MAKKNLYFGIDNTVTIIYARSKGSFYVLENEYDKKEIDITGGGVN
jgi:hypothetical protein